MVLTTHDGKEVRFYDDLLKDKIFTLNFMYANCENICPPITSNLVKVQQILGDRVGRDFFMYSLTLKPEEDTPEALRHYIDMHRIGSGWTFLTGAPEDIELLRQSLGFTDPDPELDKDTANHIGNVRYADEAKMLWGGCPGMSKPEYIVKSIYTVLPRNEDAACGDCTESRKGVEL